MTQHRLPTAVHADGLLQFFAARAAPGVEQVDGRCYRRAVRLAGGDGIVAVTLPAAPVPATMPSGRTVEIDTLVADPGDTEDAQRLGRRLFDLDADGAAVDAHLGADPGLGPLVARRPGVRVPGAVGVTEIVVRAIVGQQISVAAARTVVARLAATHGAPLAVRDPNGGLHHHFPEAATLAGLDPHSLPMPRARGRALVGACAALADAASSFEPSAAGADLRPRLLALPGVGPWTADYVMLRIGGDRDVFLAGDLAVRRAAERLGMVASRDAAAGRAGPAATSAELARVAQRWAPWRSYATMHLWLSLAD